MTWNRDDGYTAVEVNLDGGQYGFKVTGDAAMFPGSTDFAMFTEEGNLAVRAMVDGLIAKIPTLGSLDEAHVAISEGCKLVAAAGHGEVYDTMVRETICYALDDAVFSAFGQKVNQWALLSAD